VTWNKPAQKEKLIPVLTILWEDTTNLWHVSRCTEVRNSWLVRTCAGYYLLPRVSVRPRRELSAPVLTSVGVDELWELVALEQNVGLVNGPQAPIVDNWLLWKSLWEKRTFF
jgi:hypothetical protein